MHRWNPLPLLLLACTLLATLYLASRAGHLEPHHTADTFAYTVLLRAETPFEALSGLRTYGYPALLRLTGLEDGEWGALPELHFAALALATVAFWAAVARYTRSGWLALAAAVPVGCGCMVVYVAHVKPDVVGSAVALLAVACLLWLVTDPGRPAAWAGLGASIFAAYLIKPVFLFLVVLAPLLGAVLRLCHAPEQRVPARRLTLGLAAVTLLPLLMFLGVRRAIVGEMGVGNLVGYNLLGVTACFLDDELVAELPAGEQAWLAGRILHWRQRRGWRPMRLTSPIGPYEQQHTPNIFRIAEPLLTQRMQQQMGPLWPDDPEARPLDIPGSVGRTAMEMDRRFSELGWSIVSRRPLLYLRWIHDGFWRALRTPWDCAWTRWLTGAALLLLPLAVWRGRAGAMPLAGADPRRTTALLGLILLATIFFLGNLGVVLPIHWLKDRYATAAGLLVPGALGALVFEAGRWALATTARRRTG